ncbi:MAG: nuclear transport factor 2 family protein [Chloroflexi bacterium]|nr:nuclear transport factor 2 family protein [Chloroflexota bacterium]
METPTNGRPLAVIERIRRAVNEHDLDALATCFHPDYLSEQPIHPDRAFRGRDQMRKNWDQIFASVPDIRAEVLRCAAEGNIVWTEWDLRGTRVDGVPSHTAMVTIGEVRDEQIVWMRLYMEQVQEGEGIDAAVRASLGGGDGVLQAPRSAGGAR